MDGKSSKFDPGKGVVNTSLCATELKVPLRSNLDDPEEWDHNVPLGAQRVGKASEHAVISRSPVSAVGGASKLVVVSSFSAEVTTPSPCPLRNSTSTSESYQVTLSDVGCEGIKGNRSRNSSRSLGVVDRELYAPESLQ